MATALAQTPNPNSANNTANVPTTISPGNGTTDLSVSITPEPTTLIVGGKVLFLIAVVNLGPGVATGVTLSDTFPTATTFDANDSSPEWVASTGSATLSFGALAVGDHFTAQLVLEPQLAGSYTDQANVSETQTDSHPNNNMAGTSVNVTLATSDTVLNASPSPSGINQPVTLTATVTSTTSGTPTGQVVFQDGNVALQTMTLNASGQASYTTTLAAGTHTLTASYTGDPNYATSASR